MALFNKISCCNIGRMLACSAAAAVVLWTGWSAGPAAQSTNSAKKSDTERVVVSADKLISDNQGRQAEFIGNVQVTQGKSVIRSDRLKIFFQKGSKQADAIEKIVANGSVRIDFEDKAAQAETATYLPGERKLVLEGGDARIRSGDDTIRGARITIYRDNDRIQVDGAGDTRVEAVFHPEGGALQ